MATKDKNKDIGKKKNQKRRVLREPSEPYELTRKEFFEKLGKVSRPEEPQLDEEKSET